MKYRKPAAVAAALRRGGPMRHRNTPRGGARNTHREYLEDAMSIEAYRSEYPEGAPCLDCAVVPGELAPEDEVVYQRTGVCPACIDARLDAEPEGGLDHFPRPASIDGCVDE